MTKSTQVANAHINEIKIVGIKEVIEVNQNLVEDVGKAVVSCLVVGSFCGFVFMAKKSNIATRKYPVELFTPLSFSSSERRIFGERVEFVFSLRTKS